MEYFLIYLWTRLDLIFTICFVIILGGGIVLGISGIIAFTEGGWEVIQNWWKKGFIAICITLGIILIVPTKQDSLLIYFIPKVVELAKQGSNTELAIDSMDIIKLLPKALKKELEQYFESKEERK